MARGPFRTVGRDVLFSHWPVDPAALRPRIPAMLAIDTCCDRAWVTALAIRTVRATVRGIPAERSGPGLIFRTYVTHGDDAGVYFLGLDAGDRLAGAVGRRVLGLPVSRTRIDAERRRDVGTFRSQRLGVSATPTRFQARYRPKGESFRVEEGSIEAFLVDRSRFFVTNGDRSGDGRSKPHKLRVGEISRPPWLLRDAKATIEAGSLFVAAGLDSPSTPPRCHHSEGFVIDTGPPRAIERERDTANG